MPPAAHRNFPPITTIDVPLVVSAVEVIQDRPRRREVFGLGLQDAVSQVYPGLVRHLRPDLHQHHVAMLKGADLNEPGRRQVPQVEVPTLLPPPVLPLALAQVDAHFAAVEVEDEAQAVMHAMGELAADQRAW